MNERVHHSSGGSNLSAPTWTPPGGADWAGRWHTTPQTIEVLDPEDGTVVGVVADCTTADVDVSVRSVAEATLSSARWPVWQRREALHCAAALLSERQRLFADLLSREGCKPIRAAAQEVQRAVETVRLSAEQANRLRAMNRAICRHSRAATRLGWYTREPVGVVAAITPFNDPLNLIAHKVGPALIGGNGVVLKPAEHTPLTALAFVQLLLDAGVRADRLAVLPGRGASIGAALVSHPLVDLVSFTGGYDTGNAVARAAGAKKTLMELGGNGAVIMLPDADVPLAAGAIVDGAFGNAGQNCLSVQRVFVAADRFQETVDIVVQRTETLVVGSKTDQRTEVGPMIDEAAAERVERWVEKGSSGATVHTGAKRDGTFYWPTVLTGVPAGAAF